MLTPECTEDEFNDSDICFMGIKGKTYSYVSRQQYVIYLFFKICHKGERKTKSVIFESLYSFL